MASLRKFPRSNFWYACLTLPDGRRVQRSTKETSRKAAQMKADEWEKLTRERAKARQAHKVIADLYRALHEQELPESNAGDYMDAWLKRRKGEIAPASYNTYSNRITHFSKWLGDYAKRSLAEIESKQIVAYRDFLAIRLSPTSCNQGIKILRSVFEDALRDKLIPENPAKDCGLLKKSNESKRRPFSMAEIRSVLSVADGEWRSMILFGLYTGQRLGDIAHLTWANLDLTAQEIQLRTAKTGRVVRIPMCEPLLNHIAEMQVPKDVKAPLHPRCCKFATVNGSTLSRQFGELLASVGLAEKKSHETTGPKEKGRASRRAASELSFHSLRHTATSILKNAGVSPAVVQDLIGHDSAAVNAHYTHIDADAKRQALKAMPDLQ